MKEQPWLKILNAKGRCITRCKNPKIACMYLCYGTFADGSTPYRDYEIGTRLLIDGVEYNAPLGTFIIGDGVGLGVRDRVVNELNYLIDMHQAFYE